MKFSDKVTPQEIIDILSSKTQDLPEETNTDIFVKKTAIEVISEIKAELAQHQEYYVSGESETYKPRRSITASFKEYPDDKEDPNIYYGKHGIIRISNAIISCFKTRVFRQISTLDTCIKESLSQEIQNDSER